MLFEKLRLFWRDNLGFGHAYTLIVVDGRYKVCENIEGTWLIITKFEHHIIQQQQWFLGTH